MRFTFARQGDDVAADVHVELDDPTLNRLSAALRANGAHRLADHLRQRTRRIELTDAELEALRSARIGAGQPPALRRLDEL